MSFVSSFAAAALALIVERIAGYPAPLQSKFGHPVQWMGAALERLEDLLYPHNAEEKSLRRRGAMALALLVAACAAPAWAITLLLRDVPYGWLAEALLATPFLAQRSLRDHVAAVASGLVRSLEEGRRAVSHIVGRNPDVLDESGVSRAALESLAENASDGIVAPLFWFLVGGLPGIVAYKAINTADSMIGHKSERYLHFGWAAARLDDLVNLPASRLSALLFIAAAAVTGNRPKQAARAVWRDAAKHQSPNAGWPESALAGALGLSLGGPRLYGEELVDLPTMGQGRSVLKQSDIAKGLHLYDAMLNLLLAACLIGWLAS